MVPCNAVELARVVRPGGWVITATRATKNQPRRGRTVLTRPVYAGALATDYSYPPQAGCIAAIPFPKSAQDVGEQLRHGEDFLCHWETHVRITVVASN